MPPEPLVTPSSQTGHPSAPAWHLALCALQCTEARTPWAPAAASTGGPGSLSEGGRRADAAADAAAVAMLTERGFGPCVSDDMKSAVYWTDGKDPGTPSDHEFHIVPLLPELSTFTYFHLHHPYAKL